MATDEFNIMSGAWSHTNREGLPTGSQINLDAAIDDTPKAGPLALDHAKYSEFFKDSGLSEAQAKELIDALWVVVVGFVDLGFGMNPFQQAMDNSPIIEGKATRVVVSSSANNSRSNNTISGARADRAPR